MVVAAKYTHTHTQKCIDCVRARGVFIFELPNRGCYVKKLTAQAGISVCPVMMEGRAARLAGAAAADAAVGCELSVANQGT